MEFLYKGIDLAEWVGKEIVWSGEIYVGTFWSHSSWKDVFAEIIEIRVVIEANKIVKKIKIKSFGENEVMFSEAEMEDYVTNIELLTETTKNQLIQEKKQKATKNFITDVVELLRNYPILSMDEKKAIINLYL